jgi:hypothetical protein
VLAERAAEVLQGPRATAESRDVVCDDHRVNRGLLF